MQKESLVPTSLPEFEALFREAHREEIAFAQAIEEADLARPVETPWIPGAKLTLAHTLMQVVMHSQSHRGQCAARLRALCGSPPTTVFYPVAEGPSRTRGHDPTPSQGAAARMNQGVAFARTLRALDADDFRTSRFMLLAAAILLAGWIWWMVSARPS